MRLSRDFYSQSTLKVAQQLLGCYLIRELAQKKLKGKIVETEAYCGPEDKASHVYGGKKTERNKVVFGRAGLVYIYLCYGIHWQLNITSDGEKPECILIRAVQPIKTDGDYSVANGPGKLTKWMKLDKDFYGEDLTKSDRLWIEGEINPAPSKKKWCGVKKSQIAASERIGIDYAGQWAKKPWRFYIKDNRFVSGR